MIIIIPTNAQQANESLHTARVSYFGESITHPGLKFGMEFLLSGKNSHSKTNGKVVYRQLTLAPNLGIYYHPGNHTAVFLNAEIGFRIIRPKGFMTQISAGAGYQRTFLAAKTYQINQQGEAQRVYLAGSDRFMPCMNITAGKMMKGENSRIISYFGGIGAFLQYPFNNMWLPGLVLELGIAFRVLEN
jgi:hypothetical protein